MQKILSLLRRCVEDYDMIAPGERVAVGVSGGTDSLVLLAALARLAQFYPGGFSVEAFTVDMGTPGMDLSPLADYCRELGVPFHRIPTQMYHVIFETRREKNPCALCAKMRRGCLHTALLEAGIHKVALGHHYDDAVETFFLSLFYESRLSCFHPVTYLDRTDITQIRPLLYVSEAMIREAVPRLQLPVVHNPCPADGHTKRQEVKTLIASLEPQYPKLKESVFAAMQRLPLPHWAPRELRRRPPTECVIVIELYLLFSNIFAILRQEKEKEGTRMAAPEMQFIAREVESLFRAHYSKLVWYAQTLLTRNAQTSDPGRAEEAVQEAFAIAWSKWEDLFASPNPAGWLYNTVNNVVRNMIRADQQWASRLLQAQAALSHQPFQPPPGADLELEGLVSQEDLDLLKRLYLEGMTYEELAAEENLNQNTLAARVRRIKLRFQKIYREIEHFSDPPCKKSDTARHKEKRGGSKL